jgi:16S rRNA (cytosine1402-N4)-methyltransferase
MTDAAHIPVLIEPLIEAVSPVNGIWLDGTFGAGGYTRALLEDGAVRVIGVDRDPDVLALASQFAGEFGDRLTLVDGCYGDLDRICEAQGIEGLDGIVLDIGVSSMQIDQAERGFSFMHDGPLDMRMAQSGPSAADIVNSYDEAQIADIIFQFGEERASRRIARNIVKARNNADILTTAALAEIVEQSLPRAKPGQPHPATRSFQALRIAVNDELGELARGLVASEAMLKPGGFLAVVTFHSLEDRIVKRFMQTRSGSAPNANRFAPIAQQDPPRFERVTRKAVGPTPDEMSRNPRARSAKLRVAQRLDHPAGPVDFKSLGVPPLNLRQGHHS